MNIEIYNLGVLHTNCYLVYDNDEAIVIDPADEGVLIAEKIREKNLQLKAIVATHGHFDHILGVGELQTIISVPFFVHSNDEFLVKEMNERSSRWLKYDIHKILPSQIQFLKDGNEIIFGDAKLTVMETPGHTPGSICLFSKGNKLVFTGDTMFKNGIGRTDFVYSSQSEVRRSIAKIFKLQGGLMVYPGHGDTTILGK